MTLDVRFFFVAESFSTKLVAFRFLPEDPSDGGPLEEEAGAAEDSALILLAASSNWMKALGPCSI